jgi:D-glycero-D-manno-heptose 1,7-bisphosphate phosphatase
VKPAVFLDRDGTLIEERGYLDRLDLIEPFSWTSGALRRLRDAGYALVLVTNQAGVARGYFDEAFVQEAHRHLAALLAADGVVLDGYYYCPHHPEGTVPGYRRTCRCRKPGPGMVEQAASELGLDVRRSFVVGDKWLDVELAANAGARGILVRTGYGAGAEGAPPAGMPVHGVADTLADAVDLILKTPPSAQSGDHD